MIENPKARKGMISQKQAEIHFLSQGYSVCWPAVDNGFDLLIHKDDGACFSPIRVQVKSLTGRGVTLHGANSTGGRDVRRASRHAAAAAPRHYDILLIVSNEYVWLIPESETRGLIGISLTSNRSRELLVNSKWNKFREERLDGRST